MSGYAPERRELIGERVPEEPCPDCGRVLVECGADRCSSCEQRRVEYEINTEHTDPRF